MKKNLNSVFTCVNTMVGVIVLLMLTGLMLQSSYAQVRVDFEPRTSVYTPTKTIYNVRGDFTMIGNTNMTLVEYDDNEPNSQNDMRYVDVDGDPATVNSSAATLALSTENGANPLCSNIIYAGLYWTGRAHDGGSSPDIFEIGGTSADYYSSQVITDYELTITQTGSTTRVATYTFQPVSGDPVIFVLSTTGSTVNSLTVQVGSGTPAALSYSSTSGTPYFSDDWVLATLLTPYVITAGPRSITINSFRKCTENNTIDTDFRVNLIPSALELNKRAVLLKHSDGSYLDVTANSADIYYPSNTDGNMYSAYAEVTDYVVQHGPGEYTVGNIALREGNGTATGFYGGWGLVVIYENSKMGWRDITLFDGHAYVEGNTTVSYDLPVSGFSTTQSGDVNMKLGMMAGEGDVSIPGDYFQIINQASNWVSLNHAGNATNNFFNSSIFTGGNARNPNLLNNTGMDISMFAIPNTGNSIITNNQSSTTFRYGSTQDTYIIFCIAMAVDAYRPEPEGLNTLATINGVPYTPGMQALPGQTIVYQLEVRNKGTEPINNAQVVIPMPYSASYVSSSASFTYTPVGNSAPIYDAGAGATGSIVWDLGTLPLPADPDDLLATLTYTLQVTTNCVILSNANCEVAVTVDGIIEGTGATSLIEVSDVPFIQGYTTIGECEGEPIYDPVNVLIDAADYVNQNCQGTPAIPDFAYCNFPGGVIPVTEVLGNFPVGSRFYNEYPPDEGSTEYTIGNPFPATPGTITYYAVPPG
ncbi:hypothetical protein, partial [Lentimicrobium sp.]|uniref:hypothetical protein n=1 Tax=Lentimicrobium sp. TaxID=2034841 RepID=UPI002C73D0C4